MLSDPWARGTVLLSSYWLHTQSPPLECTKFLESFWVSGKKQWSQSHLGCFFKEKTSLKIHSAPASAPPEMQTPGHPRLRLQPTRARGASQTQAGVLPHFERRAATPWMNPAHLSTSDAEAPVTPGTRGSSLSRGLCVKTMTLVQGDPIQNTLR